MGLAQAQAVQKDHGVRGNEHRAGVVRQQAGGLGLFAADGADDVLGGEGGIVALVRVRNEDVKVRHADLSQQLAAAGGLGG